MRRLRLVLICLISWGSVFSQFVVTDGFSSRQLNKGISYFEDKTGEMTFGDVLRHTDFKPVTTDVPNFGISESAFWLRIDIHNEAELEDYRLQVSQPALDEIDFYHPLVNGDFTVLRGGEVKRFNAREFFDPNYIFRVHLPRNQTLSFFLRVRSWDNLKMPIILGTQEVTFESNKVRDFVFGIFAGIMVVMFLYNLFLYVTVRDKTYLLYIYYLATVILTQVSIQGYTFQFLWPDLPLLAQWSPFIFSPLVGIASAQFARIFLDTADYTPRMDKGFKYMYWAYGLAFGLALARKYQWSYSLITVVATGLSMYMLVTAIIIIRKDYKPARFFLLAWSMFLFGVTVYAMTNFGVLPTNNFTFYMMPMGAAAEVVLLSLALADRINALKREKEQSQAEALMVSQQNQKLIQEQNVMLEQKVHERTLELEEANDNLSKTVTDLKDAQAQLVNAEKMASLGQLTAGIAHEINNPINFVSANLKPLRLDINEVFDVVHEYEKIDAGVNIQERLREIDAFKDKIDLVYLKQEINTLLHGIEDGARRTAEIVSGLKNFSRLDESEIKEANINEGIESTLVLIRSSIPRNVDVILNLGRLPMIECYPGKLNQVFMNLLTNSIYAITKRDDQGPQKLIITTFEKGDKIHAVFEDTGIGMSREVREKIFEPFFTTKDVGEGTGLGMSIVFKIIESHHARVEVESEEGRGTRIILILNKSLGELVRQRVALQQERGH